MEKLDELKDLENESDKVTDSSTLFKAVVKQFRAERELVNYSFPVLLSFFSFLNFLLDVTYLFRFPEKDFLAFRDYSLFDKFKKTFNIQGREKG